MSCKADVKVEVTSLIRVEEIQKQKNFILNNVQIKVKSLH